MLQAGADWIYGIAAVMLFGTVALQATPEGTYQKYVRLFLGALLILAVLSPLFSLFGLSETTRLSFERGVLASWLSGSGSGQEEWQEAVQQKQETWLREPLAALAQEYGFVCTDYSVQWNEAGDWPQQLTLWLAKQEATVSAAADPARETVASKASVDSTRETVASMTSVDSTQETVTSKASVDSTQETVSSIISVEPVPQVGQNRESMSNDELDEAATYYEPSELRQLRQALQTVWQLQEDQIVLYWER